MASDILIVDDEADIRDLIAGILQDEGFQTREAAGSAEALSAVDVRRPKVPELGDRQLPTSKRIDEP